MVVYACFRHKEIIYINRITVNQGEAALRSCDSGEIRASATISRVSNLLPAPAFFGSRGLLNLS